jgi:hypothetical protein
VLIVLPRISSPLNLIVTCPGYDINASKYLVDVLQRVGLASSVALRPQTDRRIGSCGALRSNACRQSGDQITR